MKLRSYFFVFLFYLSGFSYAQDYIPLPDSNAVWVNTFWTIVKEDVIYYKLQYSNSFCANGEDTIISDQSYTKIRYCVSGDYQGAFRNDTGKVYYVPVDSTMEYLLYDFTVLPGDTIHNVYTDVVAPILNEFHVKSVDTIEVDGIARRKINFYGGALGADYTYWYEGIGNSQGIFQSPLSAPSDYLFLLDCMTSNDTILYSGHFLQHTPGTCEISLGVETIQNKSSDINIYPNPTKDKIYFQIPSESNLKNISMTGISGEVLNAKVNQIGNQFEVDISNFPKGLYVIAIQLEEGVYYQKIIKQF